MYRRRSTAYPASLLPFPRLRHHVPTTPTTPAPAPKTQFNSAHKHPPPPHTLSSVLTPLSSMPRSRRSDARRTHGVMARLARLAAGVLLVTALVSAATAAAHDGAAADTLPAHRCIHDELQQRILRSVAAEGSTDRDRLSPVGVPYVQEAEESLAMAQASDAASTTFGKLRILVSSLDLTTSGYHCSYAGEVVNNHEGANVTCTADDVLTADKYDILVNSLMPQALTMHTDRLQVLQAQGNWKVTDMSGESCRDFKVPDSHLLYGVNDTDFVIYLTSVPSGPGVYAWALYCQVFSNNRPAVGIVNIPAAHIMSPYDQMATRAVTHEIGHSLGFSPLAFAAAGIMHNVTGIRGKTFPTPVINSTTVVAKARAIYACANLTSVDMEDQGDNGSAGAHWKMRNAQNELMAPAVGTGFYTALTMAAFQDLGYYKANFSLAESMPWGNNSDCSFLNSKCMEDNVTAWPQYFCNNNEAGIRCTAARQLFGACKLRTYSNTFPDYFQYFTETSLGGISPFMDYCPFVVPWAFGLCNQNASTSDARAQNFNVFSDASRCIDGSFTPKKSNSTVPFYAGLCANVSCNTAKQTYKIRVYGSTSYTRCTPGSNISLSHISNAFEDGGYIICPPYLEVCQGNVKAAMDYASGLGTDAAVGVRGTRVAVAALLALLLAAVLG